MRKILLSLFFILLIFIIFHVYSNDHDLTKISEEINNHLKQGNKYYNNAVIAINSNDTYSASKNCENAISEYKTVQNLTLLALSEGKNDEVFNRYLNLVLKDIENRINAVNELKLAIEMISNGKNVTAREHVKNANYYMLVSENLEKEREKIMKQYPQKFIQVYLLVLI